MHYRTPDIIFATSGMPAPSVEEVRFEARELLQRKGWGLPLIFALHQIRDPYWREAIARCLMDKWMEMVRNRDEQVFYCDSNGNWCYCWLEAESDFNSVIRQSTNEQTEAEQNSSPATHTTNMQPIEHKTMNNYSQTNIGTQNNNCVIYNAPVYNYYGQAPSEEAAPNRMPAEGDYQAVVAWLEKEKAQGTDHYVEAGYNRSKMCRNLSDIFGWIVDQNSLRKAQNR